MRSEINGIPVLFCEAGVDLLSFGRIDACIFHSVSYSLNSKMKTPQSRSISTLLTSHGPKTTKDEAERDRKKLEMKRFVVFCKDNYQELVQVLSNLFFFAALD